MVRLIFVLLLLTMTNCNEVATNWTLPSYVTNNPDVQICKPLLKEFGSKCNGQAAIKFAKEDSEEIDDGVRRYYHGLYKLTQKFKKDSSLINSRKGKTFEFLTKFKDDESLLNNLKGSVEPCAETLKSSRKSALCFACAKNNAQFFFHDKAIISQNDCGSMVKSCFTFFNSSFSIISGAVQLAKSLDQKTSNWGTGGGQVLKDFREGYERLNSILGGAELESLLSHYAASSENDHQKALFGNQICARLYMLRKKSLIRVMASLMNFINYHINDMIKVHKLILEQQKGGRLLDEEEEEEEKEIDASFKSETASSLFQADVVIMRSSDNMMDSFVGAKGSEQDVSSGSMKPMNLTMLFP